MKINWDEWQEVTREEYYEFKGECFQLAFYDKDTICEVKHFKKKEKFPIIFEGVRFDFEVKKDGDITFVLKEPYGLDQKHYVNCSLEQLYKAVEKSKELRK